MARHPRIDLSGVAQHVVQRGTTACRASSTTRTQTLLRCLQEALLRHEVQLHAYVPMTSHVHLLVTPLRPLARCNLTLGATSLECTEAIARCLMLCRRH
jgi:putative transposase